MSDTFNFPHELIHAYHEAKGTYDYQDQYNEEEQTIGLNGKCAGPTENDIRKELGEPIRPRY